VQDMDTHVLKVEGKKTRNGNDMYYVSLGDGNDYSTFELSMANKAQSLVGQAVTARVSFKDQYKNLEDIAPQGQLASLALPGGTPLGQTSTFSPPAPMPIPTQIPMQGEAKQESINTQSAIKQATTLVAALFTGAGPEAAPEARELVKEIAREYFAIFSGQTPAQSANHVAAAVNAEIPGAVAVGVTENAPQW
jgi:hypothetical protein